MPESVNTSTKRENKVQEISSSPMKLEKLKPVNRIVLMEIKDKEILSNKTKLKKSEATVVGSESLDRRSRSRSRAPRKKRSQYPSKRTFSRTSDSSISRDRVSPTTSKSSTSGDTDSPNRSFSCGQPLPQCSDYASSEPEDDEGLIEIIKRKKRYIKFRSKKNEIIKEFEDNKFSFWGFSINFKDSYDLWEVRKLVKGKQADQYGIKNGWKIISINGKRINSKIQSKMKEKLKSGKACSITFQPKKSVEKEKSACCLNSVGITYTGGEKSVVQEVTGGSEADNEGVRKGWKISKIDENPFSTRLSRSVANSGGAFNVQFRTKNERIVDSASQEIDHSISATEADIPRNHSKMDHSDKRSKSVDRQKKGSVPGKRESRNVKKKEIKEKNVSDEESGSKEIPSKEETVDEFGRYKAKKDRTTNSNFRKDQRRSMDRRYSSRDRRHSKDQRHSSDQRYSSRDRRIPRPKSSSQSSKSSSQPSKPSSQPSKPSSQPSKQSSQPSKSSKYKGVNWNQDQEKWMAYVVPDGLGYYTDEDDAAMAVNWRCEERDLKIRNPSVEEKKKYQKIEELKKKYKSQMEIRANWKKNTFKNHGYDERPIYKPSYQRTKPETDQRTKIKTNQRTKPEINLRGLIVEFRGTYGFIREIATTESYFFHESNIPSKFPKDLFKLEVDFDLEKNPRYRENKLKATNIRLPGKKKNIPNRKYKPEIRRDFSESDSNSSKTSNRKRIGRGHGRSYRQKYGYSSSEDDSRDSRDYSDDDYQDKRKQRSLRRSVTPIFICHYSRTKNDYKRHRNQPDRRK